MAFRQAAAPGGGAKIAQHFNTVSPFYSTTAMRRGCSCLERLSSPPPALAVPGSDAEAIERWCGGGMRGGGGGGGGAWLRLPVDCLRKKQSLRCYYVRKQTSQNGRRRRRT